MIVSSDHTQPFELSKEQQKETATIQQRRSQQTKKMDEDEDVPSAASQGAAAANSNAVHAAARRHRLWVLGVLLVAGSCMLAVVHLASGLHAQLLANRRMVRALKEQLTAEGEEREALLRDKDASMSKTSNLRTKSKLVTEELLDQQRKARRLQQELLLAREDVQILSKNCTLASQRLRDRYEVTLRALHDRVVTQEECRALLERNVEDRAKVESSLTVMQDRVYNATKMLKVTKQKLKDALTIATSQRDEIIRLKREIELLKQQQRSASSSSGGFESDARGSNSDDVGHSDQVSEQEPSPWKQYLDKKSGTMFWHNSKTKVSQWTKPDEVGAEQSR